MSESIEVDPHELKDARWMSVEEIKGRVAAQGPWDGKASAERAEQTLFSAVFFDFLQTILKGSLTLFLSVHYISYMFLIFKTTELASKSTNNAGRSRRTAGK